MISVISDWTFNGGVYENFFYILNCAGKSVIFTIIFLVIVSIQVILRLFFKFMISNIFLKQVCIPVGCVPPTCCPYLPACTVQVGRECLLPGGVCSGVSAPWGCLLPGGVSSGMSAPGGVCSRGVSAPRVGVYPSMHWGRHPPVNRMTDRQL